MTQEFGKGGDDPQNPQNGTTFTDGVTDPVTPASDIGITSEQLEELRKRDAAAQAHIQKLESENSELREDKSLLANEVASSKTLDDLMARMNDMGNPQDESFDPNKVAEIVDARLQARTQEQIEDSNWNTVASRLTETYGTFDAADAVITTRASELNMTPSQASDLAKQNPTMFYELFLPKGNTVPQQSMTSAAKGNTNASSATNAGEVRDAAFYKKLMKDNPDKYWSVDVQKQYRRDVHGLA